jgi:hypothetical protein
MGSIFKNHKHLEIYEMGELWPFFHSAVATLRVIDGLTIYVSGSDISRWKVSDVWNV